MNIEPLVTHFVVHGIASLNAYPKGSGQEASVVIEIRDAADARIGLILNLRDGEHRRAGMLAQAINQAINETRPSGADEPVN
jgi:hypothetical protein